MKKTLALRCLVLSLMVLGSAASACKPKDGTPIPESGSIRLTWSAASPAPASGMQLKVIYGKPDTLKPVEYPVTVAFGSEQIVPVGVRGAGEVVSLQAIELADSSGSLVYRLARPELDPIRMRTIWPQQVSIELARATAEAPVTSIVTLPKLQFWELPPRETQIEITSVMPTLLDFFRLQDTSESLLRLRWAARASEDHHDDIVRLLDTVPAIDLSRLEMLLDAFYFPTTLIEDMKRRERELSGSSMDDDRALLDVLHSNIDLAEKLAEKSNRLILAGLLKMPAIRFETGETLLGRLHAGNEANDIAFQEVLNKIGGSLEALTPAEKGRMLQLAARKKAYDFAATVALDIFSRSEDRSVGFLLDLLRRFPRSPARDRLSQAATEIRGEITVAELAALITPLDSNEVMINLAEQLLAKVKGLTSQQALLLLEQLPPDETRDTLILMAMRQAGGFEPESIRSLLLMATDWTVRSQLCALVLPKLLPLQGTTFARILQVLPLDEARDPILFQGLALMSSLTPTDYGALSSLVVSEKAFAEFLEKATPRLTPFRMADAVATADLLLTRTAQQRDAFLIKAAEGVIDLSWTNTEELMIRASAAPVRSAIRDIVRRRLSDQ